MTDARELRGRLDELKYVAGELRPALDALLNEPEPERVRAAIVARVCGMLEDAATAERQRCAAALERLEALEAALREIDGNAPAEEPEYDDWGGDTERAEAWGQESAWWAAGEIARRALLSTPAPAGALTTTDQT